MPVFEDALCEYYKTVERTKEDLDDLADLMREGELDPFFYLGLIQNRLNNISRSSELAAELALEAQPQEEYEEEW